MVRRTPSAIALRRATVARSDAVGIPRESLAVMATAADVFADGWIMRLIVPPSRPSIKLWRGGCRTFPPERIVRVLTGDNDLRRCTEVQVEVLQP